jgi:uncharacterized membrane protein YphA (DoxX/SURF4 family)
MNDHMTLVRMLARPMLAAVFVVQGVRTLRHPDAVVPRAKPLTDQVVPAVKRYLPESVAQRVPENPRTLVRLNAAVHVVGGLALATGQGRRIGALALAASMIPTTLAGHAYWEEDDAGTRANQSYHFLKNLGLLGGLLLAAVDTEGKPGLWWRTRHGAADARAATRRIGRSRRREVRSAATTARREARIAAKAARREARLAAKAARLESKLAARSRPRGARQAGRRSARDTARRSHRRPSPAR